MNAYRRANIKMECYKFKENSIEISKILFHEKIQLV